MTLWLPFLIKEEIHACKRIPVFALLFLLSHLCDFSQLAVHAFPSLLLSVSLVAASRDKS